MIGFKLLTPAGQSLTNEYTKITYPFDQWVEVPGNGGYVTIRYGLFSGGYGELAVFECEEMLSEVFGVSSFRKVKRISPVPITLDWMKDHPDIPYIADCADWAAMNGHTDTVEWLWDKGVKADIWGANWAASNEHHQLAAWIRDKVRN